MDVSLWRRINAARDHRWAQPRMSGYVDGELADREHRRLAAHERICPDCHRVIRTLRQMIAAVGELATPTAPSPDQVADGVLARIRDDRPA